MMTDQDATPAAPAAPLSAPGPAVRKMLSLWVPLAASMVIMVLEPSIVNIGLGRSVEAELALAAYGVAFSIALLVEAPILMLIDASVARSFDRAAFDVVRRFTVVLGLAVTVVGLLVSATPLYGLIVEHLMGIPDDVAAWGRPLLVILAFWPFPIAWRRSYQGVLIRANRTAMITLATAARLVVLAGVLTGGLLLWPGQTPLVAGAAMEASVVVEAVLVTWAARRALQGEQIGPQSSRPTEPLSLGALWRFYAPLLATSVLRQSLRPVLSAGIAAAALARASLAAWPVVWALAILVAGPAWSIQQLTTALASDGGSFRRIARFALGLGLAFTLLLALIAVTPLYRLVMGSVYNLSAELQELARPALCLLSMLPLVQSAQSLFRGSLIRHGSTKTVRSATLANGAVMVVSLLIGLQWADATGALLAASATMLANLAELAWLWRDSTRDKPTPSLRG